VTSLGWWSADQVSRLLEPDERSAVQGDLVEGGASGGKALREVLGLVMRRQAQAWTAWRAWLALIGLALPLGMVLSLVSREWAHVNAIYAWLYIDNWTAAYLRSPGARGDLFTFSTTFLRECVTLVCWAWTVGFALGSLSRRGSWANAAIFALILLGGTTGPATPPTDGNAAVFAVFFYRVIFPWIARIALVLLPALWGMREGLRMAVPPLHRAILWALAVATLTWWAGLSVEVAVIGTWRAFSGDSSMASALSQWRGSWQLRLLPIAMLWPTGYLVAMASRRRHHNRLVTGDSRRL
jgi:hypothetical protein